MNSSGICQKNKLEKKMNSARGSFSSFLLLFADFPILAKIASVYLYEFRKFGSSMPPFPAAVQWELPFLATVFSSFLPSALAKSDEGKEVKIYAGPRGASDSM
ncbi:unnamed protein product [Prunus brigantina]